MRSDPRDYELVSPASLQSALTLLGQGSGQWMPIAGGTDVMVQYAAGKLTSRRLVNIWNLPELKKIEVFAEEIRLGAGCTYSDIRDHEILGRDFPMLARSARWTGGIANQNRGTIGGNIVNASPAADSLPALLVYSADLILISLRGERRVPYAGFHTGYKKTLLNPDELIRAVCLPLQFADYFHYARKVGARNAQAISKVCIAAVGRVRDGIVEDVRIALGSVAPIPLRLLETERVVRGGVLDEGLIGAAKNAVRAEIRPIGDIRSTAKYRAAVAANLVEEFLRLLADAGNANDVLANWNAASIDSAAAQILPCCGSTAWAREMANHRPIADAATLMKTSREVWGGLGKPDWMEAFHSHPRIGEKIGEKIGESSSHAPSSESSAAWALQEQREVADADDKIRVALAEGNREYERKFGYIFIICATGRSAAEMLEILNRRIDNDLETELHEAAEQQRQITQIRLRKWLQR